MTFTDVNPVPAYVKILGDKNNLAIILSTGGLTVKDTTWLSEVSDNLVSSREHVVKLGSAPSHIPLCRAFTYLIDG